MSDLLTEHIMQGLMPELQKALAGRIDQVIGAAGDDVLAAVLRQYLEDHGQELMAPVVEIERLKRKALLSPEEVQIVYGFKPRTLDDWRNRKVGPEYEKPGGRVKYRTTTLDAFCRSSRVLTSGSPQTLRSVS